MLLSTVPLCAEVRVNHQKWNRTATFNVGVRGRADWEGMFDFGGRGELSDNIIIKQTIHLKKRDTKNEDYIKIVNFSQKISQEDVKF